MRSSIALVVLVVLASSFGAHAQAAPPPPLLPEDKKADADQAPKTDDATRTDDVANAESEDGLPADVASDRPVRGASNGAPPADGATAPPAGGAAAPPSKSTVPLRERRSREPEKITLTQREAPKARELTIDDVDWTLWTGAGLAGGTVALGVATGVGAVVGGLMAADLGERKRNGDGGVYEAQQAKGVADVVTGVLAFASVGALTLAAVFSGVGFHRLEEARWTATPTGATAATRTGEEPAPRAASPKASTLPREESAPPNESNTKEAPPNAAEKSAAPEGNNAEELPRDAVTPPPAAEDQAQETTNQPAPPTP